MTLAIPLYTAPVPAFAMQDTLNQLVTTLNVQAASVATPNFSAGSGTATYNPNGAIYISSTAGNTTAVTTEEVLQTYSLPANSLAALNDGVRIRAWGSFAANGNNKTVKLYFGASVISTGVVATNNKNWTIELTVLRTAAATQIVVGNALVDTTAITTYINAGTDDQAAAVVIKCSGTNGTASAADISCKAMIIDFLG